jgi:hypothetical protein
MRLGEIDAIVRIVRNAAGCNFIHFIGVSWLLLFLLVKPLNRRQNLTPDCTSIVKVILPIFLKNSEIPCRSGYIVRNDPTMQVVADLCQANFRRGLCPGATGILLTV